MPHPLLAPALAACLLVAASGGTSAAVSPEAVGPILVEAIDRADDSCWRDPEKASRYAADRLERNGFDVVREELGEKLSEEGYVLYFGVIAERSGGSCSGTLHIFLSKPTWREGERGEHTVGPDTSRVSAPKSADQHVLGRLRSFIEQL
ncbi:MAG: hypothetical protein WD341_12900 [Tistlia sp.]|uniref:hypothetical protein n=1 Tax=Tistlia sp. TaxID=3057121 RepID=UPI0034A0E3A0